MDFVMGLVDRMVVMDFGAKLGEGAPAEVPATRGAGSLSRRGGMTGAAVDRPGPVAYGKIEAVRDVSLAIEAGQIVTVIGPNGAGKTTLLGAAIGLLPWRGGMSFDGIDLARLDVEARVERGFCLVPETRELFGDLSVSDNLLLGGYSRRRDRPAEAEHWTTSTDASRVSLSGATSWPGPCPAASGRCWRSAAP